MTPVRLEPAAPRSRIKHSITEPLRSHPLMNSLIWVKKLKNSVNPDEQSNQGSKTEKSVNPDEQSNLGSKTKK